jgi:hypothetical protein
VEVLSLAVVSVLVAACSGNGPEPQKSGSTPTEPHAENWPDALSDFHFRWSAEPGVDLAAGSAVPLAHRPRDHGARRPSLGRTRSPRLARVSPPRAAVTSRQPPISTATTEGWT